MPREQAVNIQNDFTQGLITETTALRFPENACTDADNVVFDETAKSCVRDGVDRETGAVTDTIADSTDHTFTTYLWENVAGNGVTTFLVQQVGSVIHFYDVSTSTDVSPNKKSFEVNLETYKTDTGYDTSLANCQYSSVNGDLIIVHPFIDPLSVEYRVGSDDISITAVPLIVRDVRGLDDTLTLNERVTSTLANLRTSSPLHYYNLLNQGWFDEVLTQWDTARADMPSNADYVALSRASTTDSFDDAILTSLEAPTTLSPRGKFLLKVGEFDRETAITDYGFTGTSLTGTSSSKIVTDLGTFTTIGNFTDASKAFDGVTNTTSSSSAKVRSTVDNSGNMVFNTDYTLTSDSFANEGRLHDGSTTEVATNTAGTAQVTYSITSTNTINRVIVREDSDGPNTGWQTNTLGSPRLRIQSTNVDTGQIALSADNINNDYTNDTVHTDADSITLTWSNNSFNYGSGTIVPSEVELYREPTLTSAQYIGKDFTVSGKQIVSVKIFPSSDEGIHNQDIDVAWSAKLYASNSTPTNSTDGTLLGTTSDAQNTTGSISIASNDSATSYRYVWVNVELTDSDFIADDTVDFLYIAELQFFEVDTSPGEEGEITNERVSCVTTMNSRLFYGGVNTRALSNIIYFTQVLEDKSKYGKCYQNNDPTSETSSVLLASDGGEIKINDMGKLHKLMAYEGSLLAFASNGVWRIWNQQGGFDATAFRVDRISNIGTSSPNSFVEVEGIPYWWGEEGAYRIEYNPQFRSFSVQNVTDERIRTFFLNIPAENRNYCHGVYDIANKAIIWLYNDAVSLMDSDKYRFDKALCYNVLTKAFYPWSFSDSSKIKIKGAIYVRTSTRQSQSIVKYPVTTNNTGLLYANHDSSVFSDWYNLASDISDTDERFSYDAYFVTGYRIKGELQRYHQPNYVFMYTESHATVNSSAYLQTYFDFANSSTASKWSIVQQLYSGKADSRVVKVRKLKVRGKGRAMQFKVSNDPGEFFCIVGWSVKDVANSDL